MSKKNKRRKELLRFIRRRSGRRFLVSILAKEFMTSERTIQSDLRFMEMYGHIKRKPSYNSLHRQNGNIIVYTGSRRRLKENENEWLFEG
jgi:DeoR/GlpR family transcriptional regulator of sugar metabolism